MILTFNPEQHREHHPCPVGFFGIMMAGLDFIRFIHEDPDFLVVAKPAKLAVHPSPMCRDRRTLLSLVRNKAGGRHVYPVHRLDKPVSGPVLVARSPEVCTILMKQFEEKSTQKTYVALVRGWTEASGVIDHPLKKPESGTLQDCYTQYETLGQAKLDIPFGGYPSVRYSLLKLRPSTGRYHQLRRHLRDIAHPILGDSTDGDSRHNRFFQHHFGLRRLMLHGMSLSFSHPRDGELTNIHLAPDAEFLKPLKSLGLEL